MSEQINIRGTQQAREMAPMPVKPTIIIGVGGSGGNILLRTRKRFFERYGALNNFPIISYLWLDTDATEKDVEAGVFAEQIRFSISEKVMTTMADTTRITNHLNQYPHIKRWFYPGLSKLKTMTEGAGQIRAYARLGFFEHFDEVRNALLTASAQVRNVENSRYMQEKHHMEVNPADLQIFVIFSLAGGTGSGMFLDLAFLIKELFRGEATTVGWVLMPGLFNPNEDRIFANGYAGLKELEHYSYGHDFEVEWPDGRYRRDPGIPGPPFNYTYLIDRINQSSHEVKFTNHEIIFNMVAENIFKDFTQSDFAGYKRGVRVNLDQYLVEHYAFGHRNEQGEVILDQRWIKRYSSFGMASITVPADRIEMACAYKVAADVVDHWGNLSGEGYKPAQLTETVLKDILPGIRIYEGTVQARGEDEMRHDLLNGLLDDGRKTGQRLHNLISEEVGVAAREARDGVYKDQGVTLANFLRIGIQNVAVKLRRDKHDPQQWGDYARAIHFNKETIVAEVQQLLRQEVGQMINEHHQSTGYAIALLRQVINVLRDENRNYIPHFIRERDQSVSRAQEHKRRLDELLSEIEHHETRSNWDMRKGAILRHDIDRYQETAPQYLQSVLLQQIYEAAIEVCERLAAYIGAAEQLEGEEVHAEGLIGEMYTLGSQLGNLKRSLMDKYEHFREKPMTSDLSFMLYEPEEIEKIYVPKYLGLGEKARGQIRELGDQILQELKTSVVNLPRLVREKGLDKVEHQIRDLARTPFRNIRRDYDVMEMLWKRYPNDAAREAAIRDVYKRAKFWLSGGHRPNTDKLTSERVRILVGLPQDSADTSKLAEFKKTLETKVREAGDPTPSFNNLADRSEIVFYTEVGGIPINWADSVPTLQQRYVQKQSEGEELHTDSNEVKFADLIVLDERQRQEMEDAHECFLLGLIFGKIKPERDIAGRIRYIWSETVGLTSVSRDFSLGIEMRALAELVAKPATRKKITQQIEETRDRVYVNRDLLARFNALLSWYSEEIYPETKVAGSDGFIHREQSNMTRAVYKQIEAIARFLNSQREFDSQARKEFIDKTAAFRQSLDSFAPKLEDGRRAFRLDLTEPARSAD